MTYVAPNAAAAANRASRIRKRLADPKKAAGVTDEERQFIAARGTPARGRRPMGQGAVAPRAPVSAPAEPTHVAPPPEIPASPPRAAPTEMHVIDFGAPQDAIVKPQNQCPPNCQHLSHAHAQIPRCAINGEKQYPPFKDSAAKGVANASFFVVGFVIAALRGLDEVPDPTPVEAQDGADAVKDIIATRAPELGVYSDLLGGFFSLSGYTIRVSNMPKETKKHGV